MNKDDIKELIEKHEGRRDHAYPDTAGHPTVGVGFNLDRPDAREKIEALGLNYDDVRAGRQDLSDEQIDSLLDHDVETAISGARNDVSNFDSLPEGVQSAVVDMVFNVGESTFADFENTIDALENNDFERAADEMEDSDWYDQVGQRAAELVQQVRDAAQAEPDAPEPDTPEPDAPEPDASEPDAPEPDTLEPDAPEPDAPEPDAPEPDAPEPDAPEPDAPEPDAPEHDAPDAPNSPEHDAPDAPEHDAPDHDGGDHDGGDHDGGDHDGGDHDGGDHDGGDHNGGGDG
jgi:GH24 family phage-related lysozyme (muramidase)